MSSVLSGFIKKNNKTKESKEKEHNIYPSQQSGYANALHRHVFVRLANEEMGNARFSQL